MTKDDAIKQWSDELRQDGLYVSSVLRASWSDGWNMALASLPQVPSDEALYTMDQMRDYALTFHKTRLEATTSVERAAIGTLKAILTDPKIEHLAIRMNNALTFIDGFEKEGA
jgi:hypothetical protein